MENQEFVKYRNPADYLKIFFRRKWLLIAPIFVGFVFSVIACFMLPPTYESSTVILVEEEKLINPLIQGLAVSTSVAERMRTLREQILSWSSLVELTKKLNLAKDTASQGQFETLIADLRKNIVVQLKGPNFIKLAYRGKNPEQTLLVAQTLKEILIEENMRSQTKETDVAINFLKDQLQLYKRKIKEAEISNMEEKLKALLVDSTEEHPMVKDLRSQIAAARKELDSTDYKVTGNEQPIGSANREALKKELDKILGKDGTVSVSAGTAMASEIDPSADPNQSIYKLLLMDKVDATLARDINVNENIYNMLLQKLETAKITQRLEVSKEGTRYTVIDPPRLPLKPVKPNKFMVVFLGIFLGGASGVGLVLGREFMDQSFLDIEDAKQSLELPILGAISRITTQEEIDKEKHKEKTIMTAALVVSAVLIIAVMLISFFKR
ncbi:MAG: GNVR domain-containing protein [Candidatus Omnitrophica bacterium]|nr:GNVR domain-containing protein [Candidatus Omnitrophota bacterium]